MKDTNLRNGCIYEVVKGTFKKAAEHCNKIQAEDSPYCPKHLLMVQDHELEYKRRAAKANATKERKRLLVEALEASPLKAVNPKFAETGYSR